MKTIVPEEYRDADRLSVSRFKAALPLWGPRLRAAVTLEACAMALLGSAVTPAWSQDVVRLDGRVSAAIGKRAGNSELQYLDLSLSQIKLTAIERLPGGVTVTASLDHRLNLGSGTTATLLPGTFWSGHSYVSVSAPGVGQLLLGRFYTAALVLAQDRSDPFAGETIADLRSVSVAPFEIQGLMAKGGSGWIPRGRVNNGLLYSVRPTSSWSSDGVDLMLGVSPERRGERPTGGGRHWSVAAAYRKGPWYIGVGHEDPEGRTDRFSSIVVTRDLKSVKLNFGFSAGRDNAGTATAPAPKHYRGWLVGGTARLGTGDLRFGYGSSSFDGHHYGDKLGLGYRYHLSRRTYLYSDVAYSRKQLGQSFDGSRRTGFDLGLATLF
ncbi:porin [Aquabacterium sp. A7-Y]|uniref:porin n=1 Tax=Aquabacterium sp. A7-Y TaxID=1349605 RepID=UPI00223D22ED|nr:porin [Aquabacterium sp. A7-Y]MCW7536956.1 porin [Aquabacterium sp. A7-Y]